MEQWNSKLDWVFDDLRNGLISMEEANEEWNRLQEEMIEEDIPIE